MFLLDIVIMDYVSLSNEKWHHTIIPYITHPIKSISITMSMVWLVTIAWERLAAVASPFKQRGNIYKQIIFMIIFSIIVNFSK